MRRITSERDIEEGLDALVAIDPRLAAIRAVSGEVPLRLTAPGFESLVSIVVSQQVSRASADAIMARLRALVDPLAARAMPDISDDIWRRAGMSRPKQKALVAIGAAVAEGSLDLKSVAELDAAEAIARMSGVHGIGPWTAEVYLLFAAGHPDIFPARDVALQTAVGAAFGIDPRPGERALARIAESWSPWRGVASRLFWAYYRRIRGREAVLTI
ncbi:MAG: DNA-3-methyladenine glycosylase [Rhizobiaceae bacterium]